MDAALSALLGVGLAASCGLRVFLPFVVASIAARLGWLELSADLAWMSTTPAIAALVIAAALEVAAMHVPWLDHALDVAAAPAAVVGGALLAASQMGELDPMVRWGAALIAGGGVAGAVHSGTVAVRAASTLLTGGLGNPVVASTESFGSVALAAMAIVVPGLSLVALAVVGALLWRRLRPAT